MMLGHAWISARVAPRPPLLRDTRGAVLIEFAICASAFFALLIAIAQAVLVFFVQQALQTAAEGGARYLMTGQATAAAMTADQFRAYACAKIPAILDCRRLIVDVRTADSFAALDTAAPADDGTAARQFDTGAAGRIMIVRVMYLWTVDLGPLNLDFSNAGRGKRLITGTMVFQSEPYKA